MFTLLVGARTLCGVLGCQQKLGLLAVAWVAHGKLKCLHSLRVLELLADSWDDNGSLGCWRGLGLLAEAWVVYGK